MIVEWDPENGEDKQTWQFDPDDVLRKDAALIEKYYGESYEQWTAGLMIGKIEARAVLLWYMLKQVHPSHVAVIFDAPGKTFRDDIFPEYKAHRPEPPADLRPQFGLIKLATRAFNVPAIEQDNFEADDLIATYRALLGPALAAGMSMQQVERFTIVGANAVVTRNLPPGARARGVPARQFQEAPA